MKIGSIDPEIIGFEQIVKKEKHQRKQNMQ